MQRISRQVSALLSLAVGVFAGAASADSFAIDVVEDVAPYSFLPSLARFNSSTLYTFATVDEVTGASHSFETYLWFDVAETDVPQGQVLTEALLVVTYAFDFTGFGETSTDPGELDCREVLQDWDHTTLTWTNRPSVDALPFDSVTGITEFGALICDATPIVERWIYGIRPNRGFALTSETDRVMGMYSSESGQDPSLIPFLLITTQVPEPGFAALLGVGTLGLTSLPRQRTSRSARPDREKS